jgi:lysophospholipase L1-like esterase
VVASLAAAVLTLGLLEMGVRLVMPQSLEFFDSAKIRRAPRAPGGHFELIPHAHNDSYIGVPVRINALGLRDDELAIPKPAGTVRILAIGDSVTFGYGVRLEETWLKALQARLNARATGTRYEVVNAGLEGTDVDYYYTFIRDVAPRLEPDLVLVGITMNDIREYRNDPDRPAVAPAAASRPNPVRIVNKALLLHSHLYLWSYLSVKSLLFRTGVLDINDIHRYDYLALEAPSEAQERAWRSTLDMLDRLVARTRARGYRLGLVLFPIEVQISQHAIDLYRRAYGVRVRDDALSGAPQRRLVEFAARRDVPAADLLPVFRAGRGALFLRNRAITYDPVHPSPDGHRLAGEAVAKFVLASGLDPATRPGARTPPHPR